MKRVMILCLSLFSLTGCHVHHEDLSSQPVENNMVVIPDNGETEMTPADSVKPIDAPPSSVGGVIGESMNAEDRAKVSQAFDTGPVDQPVHWKNEKTGVRYTVVPKDTITVNGKSHCREYRIFSHIDNVKQDKRGVACHEENGGWQDNVPML